MFCSTIIPTINRLTLSRAVNSVLNQEFTDGDFEVIVVNDSGEPLPEFEWIKSPHVKVLDTQKRERIFARNAGAAVARGEYLHFLDDDDWMLPGAMAIFWELFSKNSSIAWLYGGYNLVNAEGTLIKENHPNENGDCFIRFMAGEWLPLQASLIKTDAFFFVGGFSPLPNLLGGDEDVDLSRKITFNESIKGTSQIVATIRIDLEHSTTNYANLHEQSRQSRENIMSYPGVLKRLQASANDRKTASNYWRGKILWFYSSSVLWNLKSGKLFIATSRATYGIIHLATSLLNIVSLEYWRGATSRHITNGWLTI